MLIHSYVMLAAYGSLFLAGSFCHADPTDSGGAASDNKPPQRAALNQSVSLAPEDSVISAAPYSRSTSLADSAPIEPVKPRARQVLRRSSRRSAGGRMPLLRETLQADEAQNPSWYRTGFGALAIVLALVGAAAWAAKRWMPSARVADSHVLRVVSRAHLTRKQSLALVRIGRRFVAVGISGDRVDVLSEISDPEEVADLVKRTGISVESQPNMFDGALLREVAEFKGEADSVAAEQPSAPKRGGRESLRNLLRRIRTLQTH